MCFVCVLVHFYSFNCYFIICVVLDGIPLQKMETTFGLEILDFTLK
jgi:hypothetical protein